jgi:hypothetical protein
VRIIRRFENYGINASHLPDLIRAPEECCGNVNDEIKRKEVSQVVGLKLSIARQLGNDWQLNRSIDAIVLVDIISPTLVAKPSLHIDRQTGTISVVVAPERRIQRRIREHCPVSSTAG